MPALSEEEIARSQKGEEQDGKTEGRKEDAKTERRKDATVS
jgi:hypothetical protein